MNRSALAIAQLVRLPNVFTALADICLGWCIGRAAWHSTVFIGIASACLYCAGMVWNDLFDVEKDRRERPARPLPSGRVSIGTARVIGYLLIALGLLSAVLAGFQTSPSTSQPALLGVALVLAIYLYDGPLKQTIFAPMVMGGCRFLNVLLGLSLVPVDQVPWPLRIHVAFCIGLYIVGVTWFARTEAKKSNPLHLRFALGVIVASLLCALAIPTHETVASSSPLFVYALTGLSVFVVWPLWVAAGKPISSNVQLAVRRSILSLVLLDATLAAGVAGNLGFLIVLLLPPALWLGKWLYST